MSEDGFWAVARGHARNFFTNWRTSDAPVSTKLGLTLRNRLRAAVSREQCCGHHGQPGC